MLLFLLLFKYVLQNIINNFQAFSLVQHKQLSNPASGNCNKCPLDNFLKLCPWLGNGSEESGAGTFEFGASVLRASEDSVLPLLSSIRSAVSRSFLGSTMTSFVVPLVGVLSETTADMISEMRKPI